MSEKVTFGELVEIIAQESEHSKQFTNDFLKDFVSVINEGLESDRTVNIAGLGKFDLQRVDEQEGYNPQTDEKMIIPAHNKIVFKPYKDVRELINAPYAQMEPELLEESGDDQEEPEQQENREDTATASQPSEEDQQQEEPIPTEEREPEDDFIPMAPPTQLDKEEQRNYSGDSESQEKPEQEQSEPEEAFSNTSEFQPGSQGPEPTSSASPLDRPTARRKNSISIPIVVAATFLMILIAGAVWYFSILTNKPQNDGEPTMSTRQATTTSTKNQSVSEPSQAQDNQTVSQKKKATQPGQNTGQSTGSAANTTATSSNSGNNAADTQNDTENITINRGQTLWSIAEDTYGNPRLWPWIYGTNEPLDDPDVIIAGNPLDVPLPSGPKNSLDASDSLGVSKGFLATYRWYKNHQPDKAKNHLWAAKLYYDNLRDIADVQIDQADLKYANQAR